MTTGVTGGAVVEAVGSAQQCHLQTQACGPPHHLGESSALALQLVSAGEVTCSVQERLLVLYRGIVY